MKLCDFGFAKIDQGDLMTPQFTPYYVAPQVLEAQRRHQKEKSGIIPTSPTPYTYNKVGEEKLISTPWVKPAFSCEVFVVLWEGGKFSFYPLILYCRLRG